MLAASGILLTCFLTHPAFAASPTVVIASAPLFDPATALSQASAAASPAPPATRDPLVQEAARALRYDIDTIFEHVRDHVELVPLFGLAKGSRGVVLDGYGTPFDQAQFMVDALREADAVAGKGYSPGYVVGTITLNATDFAAWTGVGDAASAAKLLGNGGIPATVTGSGSSFTVSMEHIWVRATVAGTQYLFDPSLKPHMTRAGIGWLAAMGYSGSALLTAGGGTNNSTSSTNFSSSAFATQLATYRSNVESFIAANAAGKRADAVVGADDITPHPATENRRTSLPYVTSAGSSNAVWNGQIPNSFRTAFTVALNGSAYGTYYADEVGEYALQFSYSTSGGAFVPDAAGAAQPVIAGNFNNDCDQYIVGRPTVAPATATIAINHPYPAVAGTYADRTISRQLANHQCNNGLFFVTNDWGYTGSGYSERIRPGVTLLANGNPPTISFTLGPTLANVASQYSAFLDLAGRAQGAVYQMHDLIGIHTVDNMGMFLSLPGLIDPHAGLMMDFEGAVSAFAKSGVATDNIGAAFTAGFGLGYAEGAVPRQEADAVYDLAAANLITQANSRAISSPSTTVYLGTPANWTGTVSPNLTNYQAADKTALGTYIGEGYSLLVPKPGNLRQPQITVTGISGGSPVTRTTSLREGAGGSGPEVSRSAFLAYRLSAGAGTPPDRVGFLVYDPRRSSIIKAGVGVAYDTSVLGSSALHRPDPPKPQSKDVIREALNVDPRTGAEKFSPAVDLVDGSGDFPRSLSLQRIFDERDQTNYGFGIGWKSNWYQAATLSNDGQALLGRAGAGAVASSLVAIKAIGDLTTTQDPVHLLAATNVVSWLADQSINNSITVSRGFDGEQLFYKQASGSYAANTVDGSSLTFAGSPATGIINRRIYPGTSVTYIDGAGSTRAYISPSVVAGYDISSPGIAGLYARKTIYFSTWLFPNGVKLTAGYGNAVQTPDIFRLIQVSSTLGNYLKITSQDYGSSTDFPYCATNGGPVISKPPFPAYIRYGASGGAEVQYSMDAQLGWLLIGDPDTVHCPTGSTAAPTTHFSQISYLRNWLDTRGGNWAYGYGSGGGFFGGYTALTDIFKPTSATADVHVTLGLDGNVRALSDTRNATWSYYSSPYRSEVVTPLQAGGSGSVTYFDRYAQAVRTVDPLGRSILTTYDDFGRPFQTTNPELDTVVRGYDVRGNVTSETRHPKPASSLGDIVTTTAYITGPTIATCATPATCNKPSYTIDPRMFRTNYSWNATGEIASATSGFDAAGTTCQVAGGCPSTTYAYTGFTATDPLFGGSTTVYLPTGKTDTIDATHSTTTSFGYDTANKFYVREQVVDSGSLALRTCFKFDPSGNMISLTTPNAGLASCP